MCGTRVLVNVLQDQDAEQPREGGDVKVEDAEQS